MTELRAKLVKDIRLRLGDGMIDLELDPEHIDYAIDSAVSRYRIRSANAVEEAFIFLDIQASVNLYSLPAEVQDVKDIYRRGVGSTGGAAIDPFSIAFTQNMYQYQAGVSGGGSLVNYELAKQFESLAGRLFGREIMFTWNTATKKLLLHRAPKGPEEVILHVFKTRTEEELLQDVYARSFIRDYGVATCKFMMGEARSKFGSLAGPNGGGVTLNGDALKTEAQAEMDKLDEDMKKFMDGHMGMPFCIG